MTVTRGLMTSTPSRILATLPAIVALMLSYACEKPEDLGQQIITIPGEKLDVQYSDSSSIIGYSSAEDSIRTDKTLRTVLGSMVDPVFGTTDASFYTQLRLSTNNLNFGDNPVVDSITLWLQYQGDYSFRYAGKWDKLVKVSVYELTELLEFDSTYYSNDDVAYDPVALGEVTILPRPNDSIMIDSVKMPPMFRIPLSQAFGQKILNGSGTIYLSDNDNFIEYIKGFYVQATNPGNRGSLSYINLLSSNSKVTLYYHNDTDTLSQDFVMNENCQRFTHFDHHGYSGARGDLQAQVLSGGDTTLGREVLFIQPMGGIRTKIFFPYLKNWVSDHNMAIAHAELVIKPDPGEQSLSDLNPPAALSLVKIREDGTNAFLTDYSKEGSETFGGVYDEASQEYRFNITWHIQELLDGRTVDNGLWLAVSGNAVNAGRMIIGGSDSNARIRLLLTYVEL